MMMPSSQKLLSLLIMAAAVLQATTTPASATDPSESRVVIVNSLEGGDLQVHCMGERLDFGVHLVRYGQGYVFTIHPSDTADYYCAFLFKDAIHMFDVYRQEREGHTCGAHCTWFVTEAGPCLNDRYHPANCYLWSTRA